MDVTEDVSASRKFSPSCETGDEDENFTYICRIAVNYAAVARRPGTVAFTIKAALSETEALSHTGSPYF